MKKNINVRWIISIGVIVIFLIIWFVISVEKRRTYEEIKFVFENKWEEVEMIENQPEYMKMLTELSTYTIEEVKKENGEYIVSVVVSAPNLGKTLEGIKYEEYPENNEHIDEFLCERVKESDIEEKITEVYVVKTSKGYDVFFSDEFINAMTGNVYVYAQNTLIELFEEYMQGGV